MVDFGYDISNFKLVDPTFGSNEDLEKLFAEAKELGIKIILDFVPNHTSDKHDWFIQSKADNPDYRDYYVWVDPEEDEDGNRIPPNNWQSVFYGSAWEWDDGRGQYYLHQFDKGQPDLNYRNPAVVQEMKDVMTFWLDKGADGFRLDAVNHMFETESFPDEPKNSWATDPLDYGYTNHIHTKDLNETFEMVYEWRQMVEDYRRDQPGDDVLLMVEAYANTTFTHLFYGNGEKQGAHFPFNFKVMQSADNVREIYNPARIIDEAIGEWIEPLNAGEVSNWVIGNHDNSRAASKFGEGRINVLHTLTMTLPGVAITYNGEEIGMVDNNDISFRETVDPQACNRGDENNYGMSRDPERTPFQWDDTPYAGFTSGLTGEPWLPVNKNYESLNLKNQIDNPNSPYNYYKELVKLRKDNVFVEGNLVRHVLNDRVLAIERITENQNYMVIFNFGARFETINVTSIAAEYPENALVVLASPESNSKITDILNTNEIQLNPFEALVLKPNFIQTEAQMNWWKHGIFYQIYPRSFKDSDGNGVGDINGIIEKLSYLSDLGVTGIWLSPIFESPMVDFGYDISNFKLVDPTFGSNEDLEKLFAEAKELGIKIILDFVPNHTSDKHEWFIQSKADNPDYRDYYVWVDPEEDEEGNRIPPNNWQSVFYGSAWEWDDGRGQYYLHQFDKGQPDLNYRNPAVVQEMKDVMTFWLDKGADGFRLDAVNHMFETENFPDEPKNSWATDPLDYGYTNHIHTKDLNETFEMVYEWRQMVEDYRRDQPGDDVLLMVEAYANTTFTHLFYGNGEKQGAHFPFNFKVMQSADNVREIYNPARIIDEAIGEWIEPLNAGEVSNWVIGNHDNSRAATKFGEGRINVLHTLTMTLPGVAITYNGEEIGMVDNNDISFRETVDPQACNRGDENNYGMSRDPERTPFQWDDTPYAGFTSGLTGEPWLPVNKNYESLNLKNQIDNPNSPYNYYKELVKLRKDNVFVEGNLVRHVLNDRVLAIERITENQNYMVILNFGARFETINVTSIAAEYPENALVVLASPESNSKITDILNTNEIQLNPFEALVLKPNFIQTEAQMNWWKHGIFYQIYPRSFKDSDGNGVGDINGIIEKLSYLSDLGVTGIWLSPIFESPMVDFGYDISNFKLVDPTFGSNEDLEKLFAEAKELGIKIILDFVPNHTSDKHEWFIQSKADNPDYRDYYVWVDPKEDEDGNRIPPNNWQSVFYGSAWEWDDGRGQYYLHQFDKGQPDLNYRNPAVVQEMKDVMTFWLDKGADGFRLDAVNHMFETENFPDEPKNSWATDPLDYGYTDHIHTKDLNETFEMVYEWRQMVEDYRREKPGDDVLLMVEAYANTTFTHLFYGNGEKQGAHFPFNFKVMHSADAVREGNSPGRTIFEAIADWTTPLQMGEVSNWVIGNHDNSRAASKFGEGRINILHTLTMTLPGVAITYNGEEIGMLDNTFITYEQTRDPQACNRGDPDNYKDMSRDPARTPFQWDDTPHAGFTTGNDPWLPVRGAYGFLNLQNQINNPDSPYRHYKRLVELRKDNVFAEGDFRQHLLNDRVIAIERFTETESYTVLFNFGDQTETIDLTPMATTYPKRVEVLFVSPESSVRVSDKMKTNEIKLNPYESVVLKPFIKPNEDGQMNWWQNGLFYQIYPRSFKDTDGDGVGDINGIIEKLEYLRQTGVTGLWLSPIFKSPMADFGYDISDFREVDSIFGSNDDLARLFREAKAIGLKIILDFVPNHTSVMHEWFIQSKNKDPKYDNYYIWAERVGMDDGKPTPPNNWQSVFYGSAWEWDEGRDQFYLHQFDKSQPDLNYRNPAVIQEMKDVITYWLDQGADGFRMDAVNHMFETEGLPNEERTFLTDDPFNADYTYHYHTKDLPETYDMIYQFRELCDDYQDTYGGDERIIMIEAYANITFTHLYYGSGTRLGGHIPFNFGLITKNISDNSAKNFNDIIHGWIDVLPPNQIPNWVLGNHDQKRFASRYGEEMVNVLHTLTLTLPGVAITYNGEEIGMVDNYDISFEETVDPQACNIGDRENYISKSRDPERTPFQWDDSAYAGFSTGEHEKPWLPVNSNYKKKNLKIQQEQEKSVYKFYQQLVKLRNDPIMLEGDFKSAVLAENVLAFSRTHSTEGTYVILMNLGRSDEVVDISGFVPNFPERSLVILAVPESEFDKGSIVNTNSTLLRRYESLILKPKIEAEIRAKEWWETAVFYQIYPRSFKDSNGDGVGDIRGIIDKLDHLHDIGVTATWLSPVLKSPMADFGYDIEDFRNVDPLFGTNQDLDELFEKAKELGIRVIMDFVPNHTSDEHMWFKESVNRSPPYEDYYMWHDGKLDENGKRIPPNNWVSVFYGRAWTWNEKRQQYYLHQFDKRQPDLNYRNQLVRDEMKQILKYWLDRGAAGFRMDAVNHIMEVEDLRDDPRNFYDNDDESFGYVHHHYTLDMKETYDLIYEFREYIDEWMVANKPDEVKIMMTEAYTNISNTMLYYQSEDHKKIGAHFPFNFILIEWLNEDSDAPKFKETIETWLNNVPEGKISNWVLGNHDKPRVGSRYGTGRIDSLNTLSMTLPGVAITYNGDEIGMVDYRDISYKDTLDPQACNRGDPMDYKWSSRDPQRTPFQWDDSDYAGFTTAEFGKPWIPIHPNYKELNLASQKNDPRSHYSLYKRLVELRKHKTLIHGDVTISALNKRVLSYIRELDGSESFVIVINLGDFWETVDLNKLKTKTLPTQMTVVTASGESKIFTNDVITTKSLVLGPFDALVLSTNMVEESSSSVTFSISFVLITVSILLNLF